MLYLEQLIENILSTEVKVLVVGRVELEVEAAVQTPLHDTFHFSL